MKNIQSYLIVLRDNYIDLSLELSANYTCTFFLLNFLPAAYFIYYFRII